VPPSSDPKRGVGARVHTKAHVAKSAVNSKRTFGSAWDTKLVSGTVLSVVEDGAGKRVSVSVDVMWEQPAGPKARVVSVCSVTAGITPGTAGAAAHQPPPSAGQAAGADVEQDGGRRHRNFAAYSMSGSSAPPDYERWPH
jgi:hypothetical protein